MNLRRRVKADIDNGLSDLLNEVDDIDKLSDTLINSAQIKISELLAIHQTMKAILQSRAKELAEHKVMVLEDYSHFIREIKGIIEKLRDSDI